MERLIERKKRQVNDAQFKLRKAYDIAATLEDRRVREVQARDATIKALQHEANSARLSPDQIAQMISEHQTVRDAALLILGRDDVSLDGKTIEEMHRTVVVHKMGDQAKA